MALGKVEVVVGCDGDGGEGEGKELRDHETGGRKDGWFATGGKAARRGWKEPHAFLYPCMMIIDNCGQDTARDLLTIKSTSFQNQFN